MKFIYQLLGNICFFFIYSIIGLQLRNPDFLDFSEMETLTWSNLVQTMLFFIAISALSIMTTYSFSYSIQKRNRQRIRKEKVEGTDISPEVIVEDKEDRPEKIIDLLTDTTNKVIRDDFETTKTAKHPKKKSGKKKL